MDRIEGAHAFITGAANGIGLAIADALVRHGANVSMADIDQAALASVAHGPNRHTIALDVCDRVQWNAAKQAAEARFGPVDILVNNAGIGPDGRHLCDMQPEAFDRMIAIDLTSVFNGISAFAAGMRERGRGHIVNTSSLAGLIGLPGVGAYTAAKFGVVGMSETLRRELAPHGVGVSVLCPGMVATRLRQTTLAAGSDVSPVILGEVPQGTDPAGVADHVIAAICANTLYILPHSELRDGVSARHVRIIAAFGQDN